MEGHGWEGSAEEGVILLLSSLLAPRTDEGGNVLQAFKRR